MDKNNNFVKKILDKVFNNTGKMAYVTGWIDYNGDRKWEVSERAIGFTLTSGIVTLNFPQEVPITAVDTTYARFCISTDVRSVIMTTGQAPDGEVEDYLVIIEKYDFGDSPDGPYPTILTNNGARHKIIPGFFMGDTVDAELDGQPDANALGDDTNGVPDEDGVEFVHHRIPGCGARSKDYC